LDYGAKKLPTLPYWVHVVPIVLKLFAEHFIFKVQFLDSV